MIIIDLKVLIFLALLALIESGLLAIWLERRQLRARSKTTVDWWRSPASIQAAFDSAPWGVMALDDQLRRVYANPYARLLLALDESPAGLPEESWSDLLRDDISAAQHQPAASGHYRLVTLKSDQHIRWQVHALPELCLVFLMDVSVQWNLEHTHRTCLCDLSHEMQTPLTAILAHLEILRMAQVTEATRQQSLNLIRQEANRLTRLVRDLLELSRLEIAPEFIQRPVDILVVAEEAIAQVILKAEERQLAISLQADAALPRVLANPDRLKQVFLNILDNSIKYGRPGDQVEVVLRQQPNGVDCTLRDTGPGIPPQHLPYVTRRLYRVRTDGEGSGLGLSLVEEILRRHQSRLEIESQSEGEHTGTQVHFVLPVLPVEKAR